MTVPLSHGDARGTAMSGPRIAGARGIDALPPVMPHDTAPSRMARLSSWLTGGTARMAGSGEDARREAGRRLFAQIGDFLSAHDLSPTEAHFRIARRYVLGEDNRLTRAIDHELARAGRLDPEFVDGLAGQAEAETHRQAERMASMADTLSRRLRDSERVIRQGQASTRDYETALSAEADGLDRDPRGAVARLIDLTAAAVARTQRAADEDHLTGLPNRRSFDARLRALSGDADIDWAESRHSVAICDIDNFKGINDRHGHDAGDRVLKMIGKHLCRELGVAAFVARHGGEEFACLFEDMDPADAIDRLDIAREALAARTLVNQTTGEGIGQLTFSAGVAAFYGNPASAMRTADEALYLAKRRGKNRVLQSQPGNRSDELDG
jgi:diguanylate cyclase